jgi:hypothetical protein
MLAVAKLLARAPMPDRSKVMTQAKRDIMVLQVGVGREADKNPQCKTWICFETSTEVSECGGRTSE